MQKKYPEEIGFEQQNSLVEKILSKRKFKKSVKYLVKWNNSDKVKWENRDNLGNIKDQLKTFVHTRKKKHIYTSPKKRHQSLRVRLSKKAKKPTSPVIIDNQPDEDLKYGDYSEYGFKFSLRKDLQSKEKQDVKTVVSSQQSTTNIAYLERKGKFELI